ncbi:MAG: HlyD family efflux transporter periplasmic adaptor subunit [Burkholderiales bacterium]|nr:MAG: HlyD family efflux transporter periplasmic adaptor subunit [Burkholderiales bacterium]
MGGRLDQGLFRREVLEARQAQWLGTIRIGRPLSFTVVTTAAVLMAAALIAFACWGEITRKVTVHGVLLPRGGLIHVTSQQPGVVAELLAREGDDVTAGQPIARIRAERITPNGDAALLAERALEARRTSLTTERRLTEQNLRQRQDSIAQRLQSLQAEERQAQGELETVQLRVQLARKSLARDGDLARSGFVAEAQVQQRQEELLDLQLRERNAERSLQALRRDLQTARADKLAVDTQAQTTLAQLDRALASLDQEVTENDSRHALLVTAPQAGRISALPVNGGQALQAGQTVASIVPQASAGADNPAELQAQLFAPSRTAGFVQPGQEVYLRFQAFAFQKFGMAKGFVIAVSRSPIAPLDLPPGQTQAIITAAQANEPMYRITVKLPQQTINTYGRETALAAGMSVDADVRQDGLRIWEWLFEPILMAIGRWEF